MIDCQRFARQLVLPEVGLQGQEKLASSRVLIIGAGGLGCPAAMYLAAAGIGTIGLVDPDEVSLSNLHRQILYTAAEAGLSKVQVAASKLPCHVEAMPMLLSVVNADEIIGAYDVILDGTDNFAARYLINDTCIRLGKPNVYGAIHRFEGQVSVFGLGGPCYRCLFPEPPKGVPNCAEAGVLGVLPGVIGTLQAVEALKLLLDVGESLSGRMLMYNALAASFSEVRVLRDPSCISCGKGDRSRLSESYEGPGCSTEEMTSVEQVSPVELRRELSEGKEVLLLDVREPHELQISQLDGILNIPMGQIPSRLAEINRSSDIVVICRSGSRSQNVAEFLLGKGFNRVRNLATGMNGWAQTVDPAKRIY